MLIKFLSRSMARGKGRLPQLMQYINQDKVQLAHNPDFILTNVTGETTTKGIAKQFAENNKLMKLRRGKNVAVQHIVISWHPEERKHLDNETLLAFAKKFYELYEGDKALAFMSVHKDRKNYHLHAAFSASERGSGKRRRLSKAQLRALQIAMNEFQRDQYPQLDKSLLYLPGLHKRQSKIIGDIEVTLPKKLKQPDGSFRAKQRGEVSLLEQLRHRLYVIAKKHTEQSAFLEVLASQGDIEPYTYRDKPRGIVFQGKKYTYRRLAVGDLDQLNTFVRHYDLQRMREQEHQEPSKTKTR